ncbi:MAG: flavodoxin domain-containing protein [Oscillospiraceae bacterium]
MNAIIYESNSGSTQRYAQLLADKLGVRAYSLKEAKKAVPRGEECLFLGWVFANKIQGLPKAQKLWKLECVAAVGMNAPGQKYSEILKEANKTDAPLFYLRGALDFSSLKWLQKKLLQEIRSDLEKQNKPGTEEMVAILRDGCDFVCEENLAELVAFAMMKK